MSQKLQKSLSLLNVTDLFTRSAIIFRYISPSLLMDFFPQLCTSLKFRFCKIRASAFAATNEQPLVRPTTHIFATRLFKTNSVTRAELTSVIDVLGRLVRSS